MAAEEEAPPPSEPPTSGSSAASSSVIVGGAVVGVLPSAEAFAVHYPGYPSSTARAVQTLGGLDRILEVRSSESKLMELRFRPEDPCCHPVFGHPRPSSALLLKLSKTRRPIEGPNGDEAPPQPPSEHLSAEIAARVLSGYHFEGMVDFQHVLAVQAVEAGCKKRRGESDVEPQANEGSKKRGFLDSNAVDIMMLVPPLFSLKDTPQKIVLKPPANLFSRNMQIGLVQQSWEMNIETCLAIDFGIENLKSLRIPRKINWEENIPKDTDEWKWQAAVCKLFDERPIWPRWSLNERLLDDGIDVNRDILKRLLLRSGYYFSNGPFGRFWIRKGYDPRKDPEARIFQRVDFRVPPSLRNLGDKNTDAILKHTWKNICQFQVFPSKSFLCLQLFELDDDFIQQEIRKPLVQTTCARSTGWFSHEMFTTFILRVRMRFLSVFPNGGVEGLLKSAKENFERAKKSEALSRYRRSEKENLVNRDSDNPDNVPGTDHYGVDHENEHQDGPNNDEIDAEGEKEMEEAELDGFESPPEVGEEDSLLLNAGSHQTEDTCREDIPGSYLQELLCGFPTIKDAPEGQLNSAEGADACDDAFEIYEQESDGDEDYYN